MHATNMAIIQMCPIDAYNTYRHQVQQIQLNTVIKCQMASMKESVPGTKIHDPYMKYASRVVKSC